MDYTNSIIKIVFYFLLVYFDTHLINHHDKSTSSGTDPLEELTNTDWYSEKQKLVHHQKSENNE